MWRKASIALATVVLAIAGAAVFFAPASVPITEDAFPDRTGIGIELPDAKYAVEQRVTEYWEDHLTPKITTSFFSSGEMGVYHHRNDGTIQVSELFYPENEDGTRQLKVHATVDIDGVTYLSD